MDGIEERREILKLSTTTRGYIFFFFLPSSFLEEKEDNDCFFLEEGENDRVRLRGLIYSVCKRGDCNMLALALSHTY